MKHRRHLSSFLSGSAAALLVCLCLTSALAASGKVSWNFANVSLDGEKKITARQDITAANGQKVPGSILYTDAAGGKTNYLPIRAVSELLGVEIGYDSATKTVLLSGQPEAPLERQLEEARKIAYQDLEGAPAEMRAKILEARELIINNTSWVADGYTGGYAAPDGTTEELPHFSELFPGWELPYPDGN